MFIPIRLTSELIPGTIPPGGLTWLARNGVVIGQGFEFAVLLREAQNTRCFVAERKC